MKYRITKIGTYYRLSNWNWDLTKLELGTRIIQMGLTTDEALALIEKVDKARNAEIQIPTN